MTIRVTEGKLVHDVATGTADYHVKSKVTELIEDSRHTTVKKWIVITAERGAIDVQAATNIVLTVGKSSLTMDSGGNIKLSGVKIDLLATDQVNTVSAPAVLVSGGKEAKLGVSGQNVVCDTTKVAVSGAAINASAVGMHEITGGLVKIN